MTIVAWGALLAMMCSPGSTTYILQVPVSQIEQASWACLTFVGAVFLISVATSVPCHQAVVVCSGTRSPPKMLRMLTSKLESSSNRRQTPRLSGLYSLRPFSVSPSNVFLCSWVSRFHRSLILKRFQDVTTATTLDGVEGMEMLILTRRCLPNQSDANASQYVLTMLPSPQSLCMPER